MKIQVYIEGVPTMVHTSELTYKDNGDVYKHYNSDGTIDTDKELELANENIKTIAESAKAEALDKLTVTTESGKVFYADSASRIDLQGAIALAESKGITQKPWKLAEPIDGQKIVIVTLDEIKEAVFLALEAKGAIVLDGTV